MKLFEFFGKQNLDFSPAFNHDKKKDDPKVEKDNLCNEVFWHIIDGGTDDILHKKHFMDIARQIKHNHSNDKGHDPKMWADMVKAGCVDFFHKHKMKGDIKEIFDEELRKDLCQKLVDHYHEDIVKDEYNLGK